MAQVKYQASKVATCDRERRPGKRLITGQRVNRQRPPPNRSRPSPPRISTRHLCPSFVPEHMLRWQALATRSRYHRPARRCLHADSGRQRPSRHAQFYSDLVPAMIPVALLGSTVYMVRQLVLIIITVPDSTPGSAGSTAPTDSFIT